MEKLNEAICALPWCGAEVDVPSGTYDGAFIYCWSCGGESVLAVSEDGDWWLYDPDDSNDDMLRLAADRLEDKLDQEQEVIRDAGADRDRGCCR